MFDNRGYSLDFVKSINVCTTDTLKDINNFCDMLHALKQENKHIVILPDFDMDGISAGTLGYAGLSELGFRVSLFIPDPADGYGFNANTIERLVNQYPDVDAIVTCDVGITCFDGIKAAKNKGLMVLVTDHHKQHTSDRVSDVVVDPMRVDETYEHPQICGAYVFWKCLYTYAKMYCDVDIQFQINRLRVFAGIGTVSDCMPMLYENRFLVRDAISILRYLQSNNSAFSLNCISGSPVYRMAFRGLYTLLSTIAQDKAVDESFLGFYLAPLFNSVKRLDGDLSKAFGVFFCSNSQECVDYLVDLNNKRKEIVAQYYDELMSTEQKYAPYIYISNAPKGILGLLAQKCHSETGHLAIVVNTFSSELTGDLSFSGSGRSSNWYPALTIARSQGFNANGHESAFGITFNSKSELESFYEFVAIDIPLTYDSIDKSQTTFVPDFVIDVNGNGDTNIDIDLFFDYLDELEDYRPFGASFPAPVVLFKFNASYGRWRSIGSDKTYLKIDFPLGFSALFWNQADMIETVESNDECYAIGHLELNCYNDVKSVQFVGNLVNSEGIAT